MTRFLELHARRLSLSGYSEEAVALKKMAKIFKQRGVPEILSHEGNEDAFIYVHPGFTYYESTGEIVVKGEEYLLDPKENDLMGYLARRENRKIRSWEIVEDLSWESHSSNLRQPLNTVQQYVRRLRKIIEPEGRKKGYVVLKNYANGYMLYNPNTLPKLQIHPC